MRLRSAVVALLMIGGIVAAVLLLRQSTDEAAPPVAATSNATPADDGGTAQPREIASLATEPDHPADRATPREAVQTGPAVRGRLVQDGRPMNARTVRCVVKWGRPDAEVVHTVTTDSDGRFALHGLAPARITLEFAGAGIPTPWVFSHAAIGGDIDRDLGDLEVPEAAALRGRVVDQDGAPMAGIVVFHGHRPGYASSSFDRRADLASTRDPYVETDEAGRFAFSNLPPGRHFVLVEPTDHVDREESVELAAGAQHDLGDVRLTLGRRLRGHVFDDRGAALAGASVAPTAGTFSVPARRKGATTAADGSFELRGMRQRASITVEAPGFASHTQRVPEDAPPLVIELKRALAITGLVSGHGGRPTTIVLEGNSSGRGSLPPSFAYAQLHDDHEVAPDGSFRIDGLGPGDYVARATTPGVGLSVPVPFELPRDEPLRIEIVRDVTVEVRVVDDLGAAVAGARVVRDPGIEEYPSLYQPESTGLAARILKAWRRHKRVSETDADGVARIPVEPDVALAIAADHGDHLPGAVVVAAENATGPLRIALQRAGRLGGRLSDASGRTQFALRVSAWPAELAAAAARKQNRATTIGVDAQGRFRSEPLQPGRYVVAVDRFNMTWQDEPTRRLANVTPLLGGGVDPRQQVEVEVVAGEETQVELETPPLGRLRGTVVAGAWPTPGVAVWAITPGQTPPMGSNWDVDDAFERAPYTKTDDRGEFEFLVANVGAWHLYARHPDAAYPTGPLPVRIVEHAGDTVQDISLQSAEVRGRYDVSAVAEKDRKWFVAYLFRLEKASDDAFFSPHHGLPTSWGMREEPVGTTGAFAFRFLPPGVWVLRLVSRRHRIEHWQIVETLAGQAIDLGEVSAPAVVDATVTCGDPAVRGVWLRQPAPGSEQGLFVATLAVRQGVIQLPGIPPGTYTMEPFNYGGYRGFGARGRSMGSAVPLTVRGDGTTVPPTVFGAK